MQCAAPLRKNSAGSPYPPLSDRQPGTQHATDQSWRTVRDGAPLPLSPNRRDHLPPGGRKRRSPNHAPSAAAARIQTTCGRRSLRSLTELLRNSSPLLHTSLTRREGVAGNPFHAQTSSAGSHNPSLSAGQPGSHHGTAQPPLRSSTFILSARPHGHGRRRPVSCPAMQHTSHVAFCARRSGVAAACCCMCTTAS
jgi:hypothetical protein